MLFEPKPAPVFDADIKQFMKSEVLKGRRYGAFYRKFRDSIEVQLVWSGRVPLDVVAGEGADPNRNEFRAAGQDTPIDWDNVPTPRAGRGSVKQRLRSAVARVIRAAAGASRTRINEALACPACKQPLVPRNHSLDCRSCASTYPTPEGVPILLRDAGRRISLPQEE